MELVYHYLILLLLLSMISVPLTQSADSIKQQRKSSRRSIQQQHRDDHRDERTRNFCSAVADLCNLHSKPTKKGSRSGSSTDSSSSISLKVSNAIRQLERKQATKPVFSDEDQVISGGLIRANNTNKDMQDLPRDQQSTQDSITKKDKNAEINKDGAIVTHWTGPEDTAQIDEKSDGKGSSKKAAASAHSSLKRRPTKQHSKSIQGKEEGDPLIQPDQWQNDEACWKETTEHSGVLASKIIEITSQKGVTEKEAKRGCLEFTQCNGIRYNPDDKQATFVQIETLRPLLRLKMTSRHQKGWIYTC